MPVTAQLFFMYATMLVAIPTGGFSRLILAVAPIDIQMQGTYDVVAHFHYVLVAGSPFALFTACYYWTPKWTGHMVDERRAR